MRLGLFHIYQMNSQTVTLSRQQRHHIVTSISISTYVVLSVSFLFYFSSHYVICWSILFCKRNSLWTMNYELPWLRDGFSVECVDELDSTDLSSVFVWFSTADDLWLSTATTDKVSQQSEKSEDAPAALHINNSDNNNNNNNIWSQGHNFKKQWRW